MVKRMKLKPKKLLKSCYYASVVSNAIDFEKKTFYFLFLNLFCQGH